MPQETITLLPGQQRNERIAGRFFTVVSASAPFQVELNNRERRTVSLGSRIAGDEFTSIKFFETAGAANTITYDAGYSGYAGDVQTQVAPTFALGCGGSGYSLHVPAAQTSPGVNYSAFGSVRVNLTLNNIIKIPGVYQGHTRKQITFDNSSGTGDVAIFDSNGNFFLRLAKLKGPVTYELSDTFYVGGNAGPCDQFCYNETYFNS